MNNEYILMCKEASEIQELWSPKSGDIYHHKSVINRLRPNMTPAQYETDSIIEFNPQYGDGREWKDNKFWLPRQEDLQNICKDKLEDILSVEMALFEIFMSWLFRFVCSRDGCESVTNYFYRNGQLSYCTINEAWVIFTMEKVFNKIWNFETKKWEPIP